MTKDELETAIHQKGLGVRDKILFCLSLEPQTPRKLPDLRLIGAAAGWPQAKKVNLADYLGRAKGLVANMPDGWKLTDEGKQHVIKTAKLPSGPAQSAASTKLRTHLAKIQNVDVAAFVEEAIKCLEYGLLRSAVLMAWVAAVGVLYEHILKNKLPDFNKAGQAKLQNKWKQVTTFDDLADLKEKDFIELCESSSVFGKSIKKELENCLNLRNGCGHPNALAIGEPRVVTHIDQLIRNVFEKF
jgi:hypothetical protein